MTKAKPESYDTKRPDAAAPKNMSIWTFAVTVLALGAMLYFAVMWPLQKKLQDVTGQLSSARAELEAQRNASLLAPPRPTDRQPDLADFRSFGSKFAAAWTNRLREHSAGKISYSMKQTEERITDIQPHSVIWVMKFDCNEYVPGFITVLAYEFSFVWDGKCWRGIDSTMNESLLAGSGNKDTNKVTHEISPKLFDDIALKCQSQ